MSERWFPNRGDGLSCVVQDGVSVSPVSPKSNFSVFNPFFSQIGEGPGASPLLLLSLCDRGVLHRSTASDAGAQERDHDSGSTPKFKPALEPVIIRSVEANGGKNLCPRVLTPSRT